MELAEALLESFFGQYRPDDIHYPIVQNVPLQTVELSLEILGTVVNEIRSRKAPGLDGITGSVVKEFFKAVPDFLMALMRRCLDEGVFPAKWKAAKVITLLKSLGKPKELAKSYRPICLLPAWGKILEKIMVRRLREDLLMLIP